VSDGFQAPPRIAEGSRVQGYRIMGRLGEGGMAVVYEARDERIGRTVALKVMAPQWAADRDFRLRFIAEGRAAAAVEHPHVIPVHEAGDADGVLFMAMRLVTGGDLKGVLRAERPLGPGRALDLLSPVASALDAAHRVGLVHRDVKPANILIDRALGRPDHVYVSDFGLSKGALSGPSITQADEYLGTPSYSAPEQILGGRVDGRADQYALACVAFELLAGRRPFERDNPFAVLKAHVEAPAPSPAVYRPDLPPRAGEVVARALAKSPGDRYPSCQAFTEDLRAALGLPPYGPDLTPPSGPKSPEPAKKGTRPGTRRRPARRLRVIVAAAAVVAAVTIGAPFVLTERSGHARGGAPHPTGTTTASSPATPPLTGPATATYVAALSEPGFPSDAVAFSPDGTEIAVGTASQSATTSGGGVSVWNVAARTVTGSFQPQASQGVSSVAFLAGGKGLALENGQGEVESWTVGARTATGGFALPNPGSGFTGLAYDPAANQVAVADGGGNVYLWTIGTDAASATLSNQDILSGVALVGDPKGHEVAISDDIGNVYIWDTTSHALLATITVSVSNTEQGNAGGTADSLAWSPDGSTLAVGTADGHVVLYDMATYHLRTRFAVPHAGTGVSALAYAPGGVILAVGTTAGTATLWDTRTATRTATLSGPGSASGYPVKSLAFSPASRLLAIANLTTAVSLWRLAPAL
jgi:serine/threonine protein kinase